LTGEAPQGSPEAALLQRIRQWDTVALGQVYDDYYDRIYRYICCYLGRADAAEDLAANVFTRLLIAVRNGNSPRSNLSAWLYRVAHNLVVDTFRRKPVEDLEAAEWLDSGEPDLTHTVEQNLQLERVRTALQQLTATQQQVIVCKFLEGMDSREVAQILGKSEGAVDALQHRALLALRRALSQGQGPGTPGPSHAEEGDQENVADDAVTPRQLHRFAAWLAQCLPALVLPTRRHKGARTQREEGSLGVLAPLCLCGSHLREATP
jgi:RNA polymerase sigma-70 factor (ECF subfamily)